ncbi:MAG: hypothetical protein M3P96_03455 [Actinomycetota bacterium]|nr:hypothetical protein [Actinomycetota bacterium]
MPVVALAEPAAAPSGSAPYDSTSGMHVGQLCLAVFTGLALGTLLLARARTRFRLAPPPPLIPTLAARARRLPPGPSLAALTGLRI